MSASNSNEELSRPPSVDDDGSSDNNGGGAGDSNNTRNTMAPTTHGSASPVPSSFDGHHLDDEPPTTNAKTDDMPTSPAHNSTSTAAQPGSATAMPLRICLVGTVVDDTKTVEAARSFGVPVVTSETGDEFVSDAAWTTYFVLREFEGPMFEAIQATGHRILGPPALQHHQTHNEGLVVNKKRPIYNYSMKGVITCFTGIRNKGELTRLVNLIHSMGGSIRSGLYSKVTHLICNASGGPKYQYAMTFRLDVVRPSWVHTAWEQRDMAAFSATAIDHTAPHRLKPFEGQKICFLGFAADEHQHMIEVLVANGGVATQIDDPECSHVIISNTATHFPDNLSNSPTTDNHHSHPESPPQSQTSPLSAQNTNHNNRNGANDCCVVVDRDGGVDHNDDEPNERQDNDRSNTKENHHQHQHNQHSQSLRKRKRAETGEPNTPPSQAPQTDGAVLTECADGERFAHHTANLSPILKPEGLQNIEEASEDGSSSAAADDAQNAKRKRDSFDNISLMSTDSMMMAPSGPFSSAKKPKLIRTGSITRGLRRSMSFVALKNPIATVLRSRRNSSVDPNASLTSVGSVDSHTFNESIKKPVAEKMRSLRNRILRSNKRDITPKGKATMAAGSGMVRQFRQLDEHTDGVEDGGGGAGVGGVDGYDDDGTQMATAVTVTSDFKTPLAPRSLSRFPHNQQQSSSRALFARTDPTPTVPAVPVADAPSDIAPPVEMTVAERTDDAKQQVEETVQTDDRIAEDEPECGAYQEHHAVTDTTVQTKPEPMNENTHIVKPDWFWYSIQNGFADENEYLYKDYLESIAEAATPSADRRESLPVSLSGHHHNNKRKRKLLSQKVHETTPSGSGKRRSSVSDAGLLSASGSLLDYTASPSVLKFEGKKSLDASASEPKKKSMRYNHFMDLFGTESNYVGILHTIVSLFQKPLEEMADKPDALLNKSEVRAIFNNFSPIHDVHMEMLNRFNELQSDWSEDCLIGKIIIDHREALIKAYPPYVNFFEQMRDALGQCDSQNPRFHAFLKINQAKAECGRQTLQDLMIRPVQRLPSICLLISDLLKHTPKTNPDYKELEKALKAIKEVMTYINEDKRKMEGRLELFNIFNDIEGCPADLVASHRRLVSMCEVTELSNTLSGRDDTLILYLFTDYMEVCKVKKSRFNNVKSPISNSTATLSHGSNGHGNTMGRGGGSSSSHSHQKKYKHVKLLPLKAITTVCDIQDGERAFALCAAQKDKVYAFNIAEDMVKSTYLKGLCKQLAEKACTTDADQFLRTTTSTDLNIDISDLNLGTLKKAFNYARTRLKVTRAFSFNKTPMKLIRRPVMSPQFGSTNSLTPASQLAKMKLASCTNINEVGNEDGDEDDDDDDASSSNGTKSSSSSSNGGLAVNKHHLVAPMSVQPTRKATLSMDALRRL